ncbi:RagB/SusD family nutrient uptake outer membrane protein [Leeuwenhoekiella parthenopeia]|uniref:RagB/SusD family nutrient uptake outer membrane protein n=1 Tax=Leeuwenhoekiella parthenopeia TaxID=2890320 RepID=A0ABS8GUL7_9FLAO|nr:RagB/SusD family nutrient uptake outer membrane protein [Leeuwenhoekiella parthenopeia]MCC4213178.1 RagB/SusD family nutrient uptake outer membrane protein [Leeuwenhoekiella parthenopeia]
MKNILFKKSFKRKLVLVLALPFVMIYNACQDDYLDVVPDGLATVDKIFNLRQEAEKYLFTCYSYMPRLGDLRRNAAFLAGDEMWVPDNRENGDYFALEIALGRQRVANPYYNVWQGEYQGGLPFDGSEIWDGIRHCNIFIENMSDPNNVPDITDTERERWIAEAKFLKAYYHFYLMRHYGAIPIIKENVSVDAPTPAFDLPRDPYDEGIDYIVELLDEAAAVLPPVIADINTEYGRITSVIARSLKARVLVTAASPLYNGNPDLSVVINNDGTPLYNTTFEANKWQIAADAAKEAIDAAEAAGLRLYEFNEALTGFDLTDTTVTKLSIRNAITDPESLEIIWPNTQSLTNGADGLQASAMAPLEVGHNTRVARKVISPTITMAKLFYTDNGVPITEDKAYDFNDILELREAQPDERYNIEEGYRTSRLNFDREPRFYADLGFDGSMWYKRDALGDETKWHIEGKFGDYSGSDHPFFFNETGYYCKKLVNWRMTFSNDGGTFETYAWPEMRLADLYLLYAEALNEVSGPSQEVYSYLDQIRERAGLDGVVESWAAHSNNPNKPTTKEGLRSIIQQERMIELAFEGQRYWDLLRWKRAVQEFNDNVQGWNVKGDDEASYYQIRTIHLQNFISPRDYFWPLSETSLIRNTNLVQNPGW